MGTCGSNIGKHGFQRLATRSFSKWKPLRPRLGNMGSNLLGTSTLLKLEPEVPTLGSMGPNLQEPEFHERGTPASNVWEAAVPPSGNLSFQSWKRRVSTRRAASSQKLELMRGLGTQGSHVEELRVPQGWSPCFLTLEPTKRSNFEPLRKHKHSFAPAHFSQNNANPFT